MKYQLWDMIKYGDNDSLLPFTLIKESNTFEEIYLEFNKKIKNTPCDILIKIYEKSIYNRY